MKLSKIFHRDEFRIKITFDYNNTVVTQLRQIIELRWSQTHKAWHAPYNKEVFDKILKAFPNAIYEKKENAPTIEKPSMNTQTLSPL